MENKQNNKPYNVTIIYDAPKRGVEVPLEIVSDSARTGSRRQLQIWQVAVLFGVVFALLWAGGAFSWFFNGEADIVQKKSEAVLSPRNPFENISVEASAAIVFDISKQKVIYEKNAELQLPLASLTKLMTALIAEETLPGNGTLTVNKDAIAVEGDNGLLVGERWRKRDLIGLTLLASSNDGAYALASAVEAFKKENESHATSSDALFSFTDAMNERAQALGMSQTYFLNAIGLDVHEKESGAYGSARDMAVLLEYILRTHPDIFDMTQYEERVFLSEDGVAHTLKNTNERIFALPGLVASKTGFTDLAGGNLAVLFEAGPMYPIAVVVLGSSAEGRFTDVENLASAALGYLNLKSGI